MDRLNLFLIPQRYSLVRSGTLLSVISLDDETSIRQLDAMARLVEPDELAELGPHELVKCLLPLGEIQSEKALPELAGLLLIREPVLLRQTNQLLVTETAGKLRMVQARSDFACRQRGWGTDQDDFLSGTAMASGCWPRSGRTSGWIPLPPAARKSASRSIQKDASFSPAALRKSSMLWPESCNRCAPAPRKWTIASLSSSVPMPLAPPTCKRS